MAREEQSAGYPWPSRGTVPSWCMPRHICTLSEPKEGIQPPGFFMPLITLILARFELAGRASVVSFGSRNLGGRVGEGSFVSTPLQPSRED